MEFKDKKIPTNHLNPHDHNPVHHFEVVLETDEEYDILHTAMNSLATNLLTGRSNGDGIEPRDVPIVIGYIRENAVNPKVMTFSPASARRFAGLLYRSGQEVADDGDRNVLHGMADAIEGEAVVRSFNQQIDSKAFDAFFAE